MLDAATGQYTYTPGANFNGSDSFQVNVADPSGAFTTQTVTVGVAAVNDAPVIAATSVAISTNEDTSISGAVVASDVDGDVLGYAVATGPAHGALVLDAATGQYTYTPGSNFNGSDSFQVKVADPSGAFTTQTVNVGVAAVNDAPVIAAASVAVSTNEDTSISGAVVASDVDGDVLGYAVATGPAHGALVLEAATGQYTYTPGANAVLGDDALLVGATDPAGAVGGLWQRTQEPGVFNVRAFGAVDSGAADGTPAIRAAVYAAAAISGMLDSGNGFGLKIMIWPG